MIDDFNDRLVFGKSREQFVSQCLTTMGLYVTDISSNLMENGRYSPFDLHINNCIYGILLYTYLIIFN